MKLNEVDINVLKVLKPKFFYVKHSEGVLETFRFTDNKVEYWNSHHEEWAHYSYQRNFDDEDYLEDKRIFLLSTEDKL